MGQLLETPLHGWHAAHGGRLVDFAGWSMPVQYTSIVEEHLATRNAAGLFDVSHMGRLSFHGEAAALLDRLVTRKIADMQDAAEKENLNKIRYALVTNEQGGILDDVLVYRVPGTDGCAWRMVVNASNRRKIVQWINAHLGNSGVALHDATRETAMIAVQGPRAIELVQPLVEIDLRSMKYYTGQWTPIFGQPALVSRTGYTGEDGCELIVPAASAVRVWESLLAAGEPLGARPAGLAARDTLRLEAAMPLYGHELSESINPYQAGLEFAVNLAGRNFIGRDALARLKDDPQQPRRIGLDVEGRRVPREGHAILAGETPVGSVTSGTFSPTFQRPIAMGYVQPQHAAPGTELSIDIRGQRERAVVVPLPFYKRQT